MKNKLFLPLCISILMVTGCQINVPKPTSSVSEQEVSSEESSKEIESDNSTIVDSSKESSISSASPSSSKNSSSSSTTPSSASSSSSKSSSSSSNKWTPSSTSRSQNIDYTIEDWTNWQFYDEYGPTHNEDWEYLYGTSYNPNGVLFTTPNDKHTGDGIIFEEKGKQSITSPTFQAWKKVEVRYTLWFSNKTGKKGQNKDGDPTLIFDMYSISGTKVGTQNITIEKSKVPSNNTTYELKFYLANENMNYFKMTYNSPVRINDDSGYAVVIHEISMKGWPYDL